METKHKKLEQFRLPQDLVAQLVAYSKASGMDKTEIVEIALRSQMAKDVEAVLRSRIEAVKKLNASSKRALNSAAPSVDAIEAKALAFAVAAAGVLPPRRATGGPTVQKSSPSSGGRANPTRQIPPPKPAPR